MALMNASPSFVRHGFISPSSCLRGCLLPSAPLIPSLPSGLTFSRGFTSGDILKRFPPFARAAVRRKGTEGNGWNSAGGIHGARPCLNVKREKKNESFAEDISLSLRQESFFPAGHCYLA